MTGPGPFTYQWQHNGTNLPNGIITTIAGNGTAGYSGDGHAATNAKLNAPLVADANGNLFIADCENDCIRQVDTNGIITTVVGIGPYNPSYSGDGGPATSANLDKPIGVAMDTSRNLFIVDWINHRIRKVGTNGIISTVAGCETSGYSGDGGVATRAEWSGPGGVAVDTSGNLFIADWANNRIRKVAYQGPTLALNHVSLGDAGAYDLIVSNANGSVTSSVVNLIITRPALLLSAPKLNGDRSQFTFHLSGPAQSNYVMQVSTDLSSWNPISTSTLPAIGTLTLTNTPTAFSRFYRAYLK